MSDFQVEDHGNIFLLRPVSRAGDVWCEEHLPQDAQRFGSAYVVEHRYIGDIVQALCADGYKVRS